LKAKKGKIPRVVYPIEDPILIILIVSSLQAGYKTKKHLKFETLSIGLNKKLVQFICKLQKTTQIFDSVWAVLLNSKVHFILKLYLKAYNIKINCIYICFYIYFCIFE